MRDHMRIRNDHMRIAALSLALFAAGCGASRVERMTIVAGSLHSVASGAGRMIDRAAEVRGAEALAACHGYSQQTCERSINVAIETLRPAQSAQHVFAAAVDAYVAAVITAAQSDDPDWGDALRHLGSALDLYEQMRVLLAEFGVEAPLLPDVVLQILEEL